MFKKILIANRGEIACRIMKTAQKMGVECVAIYHAVDKNALYIQQANEAYEIKNDEPSKAYLDGKAILKIANDSGAAAIHPGYGFLSENANFARDCAKAKISFIGPMPETIEQMGEKGKARQLMVKAGLPVLPGYDGDKQDAVHFKKVAADIGYPVLLKASAGGGGKGMRVVEKEADLEAQLTTVKREAEKLFKNDHVILEKYLKSPRHIEIQIFADGQGNAVHLFERECSLQRRHQKIIEEAPAPNFPDDLRQKMGEASTKAAIDIGYKGAGTFEFLLDADGQFYFMEMNTRLQVEHPVTELITGVDLVEWQLRIASGEKLSVTQNELSFAGHAIEARICAEDVINGFLPAIGKIEHLRWSDIPDRIETGVEQGDEISPYFDSMIAKLVTYGGSREIAIDRMQKSLAETHLIGLRSNLDFLAALTRDPHFRGGKINTKYVEDHYKTLIKDLSLNWQKAALAVLGYDLLFWEYGALYQPHDLWQDMGAFYLNHQATHSLKFIFNDEEHVISAVKEKDHWLISFGTLKNIKFTFQKIYPSSIKVTGGDSLEAEIYAEGHLVHIYFEGRHYCFSVIDPLAIQEKAIFSEGHLMAPMPGKVIDVLVKSGMEVKKGASLIVIEAMKMEHSLTAPSDGIVKECFYKIGDQVTEGVTLIDFEANL